MESKLFLLAAVAGGLYVGYRYGLRRSASGSVGAPTADASAATGGLFSPITGTVVDGLRSVDDVLGGWVDTSAGVFSPNIDGVAPGAAVGGCACG